MLIYIRVYLRINNRLKAIIWVQIKMLKLDDMSQVYKNRIYFSKKSILIFYKTYKL